MSKLEEIIRDYHCYDQHGDCFENCQECENSLREDLMELIAKVRADAIDECIHIVAQETHDGNLSDLLEELKEPRMNIHEICESLKEEWYSYAPFSNVETEYDPARQSLSVRISWLIRGKRLEYWQMIFLDGLDFPVAKIGIFKILLREYYESLSYVKEQE